MMTIVWNVILIFLHFLVDTMKIIVTLLVTIVLVTIYALIALLPEKKSN